eukprot:9053746-Alexandrium_andersonii.AAC.1
MPSDTADERRIEALDVDETQEGRVGDKLSPGRGHRPARRPLTEATKYQNRRPAGRRRRWC